MAEYSLKWHNDTSRGRSTETSNGLAAIQAQLNNLGREIKKVNEKVYATQVGCEQCKGPHYTKDCPLKEEGKTLEEAYYTQFGGPFQGGGYKATAPGFYQRNNANPSYQERRQSMEDTLSKFMGELAKRHEKNSNLIKEIRALTDAAIRNQGASIKTLEIQIRQMSKDLNSIMKDKMVYKGDNVVGALMNVPIFVGTFSIVTDFAVLEDMNAYEMKEWAMFKRHTNEQCNKIPPLLKVSEKDEKNGISHAYQKLKGFYKGVLNLGPDYLRNEKTEEWLTQIPHTKLLSCPHAMLQVST
ncbi:homeodomain-like protein [Tanacetum coccineum]